MGQRTALQGIDWLEPWKSAASFKDMSASLSAYATKHFIRSKESQFRNKMDSLNQHLREHEIHLLFGALRSKMASSFVVSPTCKFIQFVHYFRQSSIFALSLKATVLRCLVKDPDVFSTPAKLKSALQENVSHEMFSDHLQLHFDEVNVRARHRYSALLSSFPYIQQAFSLEGDMDDLETFHAKMIYLLCGIGDYSSKTPPASHQKPKTTFSSLSKIKHNMGRGSPRADGEGDLQDARCGHCEALIRSAQSRKDCSQCNVICHLACLSVCLHSTTPGVLSVPI
jgi:hypothetical protein